MSGGLHAGFARRRWSDGAIGVAEKDDAVSVDIVRGGVENPDVAISAHLQKRKVRATRMPDH